MTTDSAVPKQSEELGAIAAAIPDAIGGRVASGTAEIADSGVAPGLAVGTEHRTSRSPTPSVTS